MTMKYIQYDLQGSGYERRLRLYYRESLIFSGYADDLVTSVRGHLQLRLAFSGSNVFPHAMKVSGGLVLLVPEVSGMASEAYMKLGFGAVIFPVSELLELWANIGYDSGELESLGHASSNEIFLLWMLSSRYVPPHWSDVSSLPLLMEKNIIAEDVDGDPSVKDIVRLLGNESISLGDVEFSRKSLDCAVTVYIDKESEGSVNWRCISVSRDVCLIGSDFVAKINFPTEK